MLDQSHWGEVLDLNKEIIKHPASTFYARVSGDSMKDAGIDNGDLLVIDKSLDPETGGIAVCCLNGEFTLKFIEIMDDHILLVPANKEYEPIRVEFNYDLGDSFIIWGIVTHVIKKTSR